MLLQYHSNVCRVYRWEGEKEREWKGREGKGGISSHGTGLFSFLGGPDRLLGCVLVFEGGLWAAEGGSEGVFLCFAGRCELC